MAENEIKSMKQQKQAKEVKHKKITKQKTGTNVTKETMKKKETEQGATTEQSEQKQVQQQRVYIDPWERLLFGDRFVPVQQSNPTNGENSSGNQPPRSGFSWI